MRKVKVWGGEHGNEVAALAIADSLMADPETNVDADIANRLARARGKRWVNVNFVRAYPGNRRSSNYAERRAVEVVEESQGYYAVCSLHNFAQFGESVGIVDAEKGVSPLVLGFLGGLGLRKIVLSDYGGIQRHAYNAFALELDPEGLGKDIEKLRRAFGALANNPDHPVAHVTDFDWFRILPSLHIDQFDPNNFTAQERKRLHNFEPLPENLAERLGHVNISVQLLAWQFTPNEEGYWGEAITPVPIPDDSLWPK